LPQITKIEFIIIKMECEIAKIEREIKYWEACYEKAPEKGPLKALIFDIVDELTTQIDLIENKEN